MKTAKIGIMSLEQYKKRTISIAKGEYKPHKNEPKIWFTSLKSLANVLSEDNQYLIKLIIENEPESVSDLEALTGHKRRANNILRTLRTMEQHGIVKLTKSHKKTRRGRAPLVPKAIYDKFDVEFAIQSIS